MQNIERFWDTKGTMRLQKQPNLGTQRRRLACTESFPVPMGRGDRGCYIWVSLIGSKVAAAIFIS